jgi:hypothetical protein
MIGRKQADDCSASVIVRQLDAAEAKEVGNLAPASSSVRGCNSILPADKVVAKASESWAGVRVSALASLGAAITALNKRSAPRPQRRSPERLRRAPRRAIFFGCGCPP